MKFRINNCKVYISFLFVVVLSIYSLLDCKSMLYILLFSSLHESGHLICLYLCGGKASEITFSYYGFALKYNDTLDRKREAVVLSGGCLVNLILYLIFRDEYNLMLLTLNILPVFPLDGGRILMLFFPRLTKILSIILVILIFLLSLYLLFNFNSFSLLLISVYLTVYSINQ